MQKAINFIKKNADYIVLFLLNAVEMILELVASRLMSPYFGNSNFVWTAIIGIILLASSLGNILGGKIASNRHARFFTAFLLLFTSFHIALTPLLDTSILRSIVRINLGVRLAAVLGSIIFFLIPSIFLGVITPIIMRERIGNGKNKGEASGGVTATIAIGSLTGTFLGGFFLIPALGTKTIFILLALIIAPITLLIRPLKSTKNKKLRRAYYASLLLSLAFSFLSLFIVNHSNSETMLSIDTEYGRIILQEGSYNDEDVLYYRQSGAYSSATYLSEDKKYELVFEYLKKYDLIFEYTDVKQTAMIGGAAYQYPKYYISHFPDKSMDVIEIDPASTKIAKQYFFLDDLLQDYGEDRLGLYNEDGRVFLSNSNKQYDAILNDAFSGDIPVGILATKEAAKTIKKRLNPNGIYISNVLGAVSGDKGKFLRAEAKTLKTVFKNVYVVPVYEDAELDSYSNWMLIATDNDKYRPANALDVKTDDKDIVLTDDYSPIDSLIPKE